MKTGFDNDKYLKTQSEHIRERIGQFGDKLYLEFGGKLFDDFHASRVLPGFEPDSKLQMLQNLKDQAEIVIAVSAEDVGRHKIRADLGISYGEDVLRLTQEFRNLGFYVGSVCITRYAGQEEADKLQKKCEKAGLKVYHHYYIEGYPGNTKRIISPEGFGRNEFIETERPLVVVTAPGPGSGKMATCLSQLYQENVRGVKAGYAKFETFPIWSIPLNHPVNLAYEAATADLEDVNLIDPYHLNAYGEIAVNYNRDVEIFPVLKGIFEEIFGESPYQSPTDMGVNMAGFCISDNEACEAAAKQEIIRRYFDARCRLFLETGTPEEFSKLQLLMNQSGLEEEDRICVARAREKEAAVNDYAGALELEDGRIVTGRNSDFMGPCSAVLMNSLKTLAGIPDETLLIAPEAFSPIQQLKTSYLGSENPRLHSDETLIALALSAKADPLSQQALEQLPKLKGAQAHITSPVSQTDLSVFHSLGIQVTYEADKVRRDN